MNYEQRRNALPLTNYKRDKKAKMFSSSDKTEKEKRGKSNTVTIQFDQGPFLNSESWGRSPNIFMAGERQA